jgi:hypothetical protein
VTDKTIDLDQHRGMAARRPQTFAGCWRTWRPIKAHCVFGRMNWKPICSPSRLANLLNLLAATLTWQDPRRQKLIAAVLAHFERLSDES